MMIEQTYTKIYANPCKEKGLEKRQGVWKRPLTKQEQKKYKRYRRWHFICALLAAFCVTVGLTLGCMIDRLLPLLPWLPIALGLVAATVVPVYAACQIEHKQCNYIEQLRKTSFIQERVDLDRHNKAETKKARLLMLYLVLRQHR